MVTRLFRPLNGLMKLDVFNDLEFDKKLSASVPQPFYETVRKVADVQGLTIPDFVRAAVCDRLTRADVPHLPLPPIGAPRRGGTS
jgi:hypothetical protein